MESKRCPACCRLIKYDPIKTKIMTCSQCESKLVECNICSDLTSYEFNKCGLCFRSELHLDRLLSFEKGIKFVNLQLQKKRYTNV